LDWPGLWFSIYTSHIAGWHPHCTMPSFYWLRWDLANFLPRQDPNCDAPDLCSPSRYHLFVLILWDSSLLLIYCLHSIS
jgi:hypothetical protein